MSQKNITMDSPGLYEWSVWTIKVQPGWMHVTLISNMYRHIHRHEHICPNFSQKRDSSRLCRPAKKMSWPRLLRESPKGLADSLVPRLGWQLSVDVVDVVFESSACRCCIGGSEEIRNVAMISYTISYSTSAFRYSASMGSIELHWDVPCGFSLLKCPMNPMNKNLNTIRLQNDPFRISAAFHRRAYLMGRVPTERSSPLCWKDFWMHHCHLELHNMNNTSTWPSNTYQCTQLRSFQFLLNASYSSKKSTSLFGHLCLCPRLSSSRSALSSTSRSGSGRRASSWRGAGCAGPAGLAVRLDRPAGACLSWKWLNMDGPKKMKGYGELNCTIYSMIVVQVEAQAL